MELSQFQELLRNRYSELKIQRANDNYPVYALEHGLSQSQILCSKKMLNESLQIYGLMSEKYWLVWVAAAAEVGYIYDGTEYWDTFELEFPNWGRLGDRNVIRNWFKRFAIEFKGLSPHGQWAEHFPIIAWPITQAILPRYLQRHFVNHLYQLRHLLARSGELTLDEIGDLLSERYLGDSSRFVGFLQQKALTARIVMALGLEDVSDVIAPIEAATLGRIVRDIDSLGSSGSQLREARRVLRDACFVNPSREGFTPSASSRAEVESARVDRPERPRLLARPIDTQLWNVALSIPDLAMPLRQRGLSPHELERSRMRFRLHGDGNAWVPGRALFSYTGQSTETLAKYPTADRQIFEFDRAIPLAEAALRERLTLPAQPLRLLKIRTDGSAFEVAGRHVRADQSYLLISAHPFAESIVQSLALSPLQTEMTETYLWKFDVRRGLGSTQIAALKSLGLGYVLGVHIEPLGLTPRWNPSNGVMEFLDTETPLFCITSDVSVREFSITVDANPPLRFKPAVSGKTYISIGELPVGPHRVVASALGAATGTDIESDELAIEVRPTHPWQQAIAGKAGVSLLLEPRHATLEQLFSGGAHILVAAPPGRNVRLDCRFYGADDTLFHDETIGRYATPISDQKLSELVVQKLTCDAQAERLERAVRIELAITLDEYGAESVTFEKEAEPLRWVRLNGSTVRLSDDSAGETLPTIECYDLSAADKARAIEYQEALEGIVLSGKGGLLVAKNGKRRFLAIATVMQSHLTSFSDLGVPARLSGASVQPAGVINALKRWHSARRLMGPMAFMARRNAIRALEGRLECLLCGEDWIVAANSVRDGAHGIGDLYGRVFYSRGFGAGLRAYDWRYETEEAAAVSEFIRLSTLYKVSDNEALCRFALKMAFAPSAVAPADLPSKDAFEALKTNAPLIRGAYFARVAADMRTQDASSEAA